MESIGIFLTSGIADTNKQLLDFGVKGSDLEKLFYDGVEDSNLYICLYTFEDEDMRDEVLEVAPEYEFKTVIGIDIGRSPNSWLACLKLISSLNYESTSCVLIDDSLGGFWRIEEIKNRVKKNGREFLESYVGEDEIERIWKNVA